MNRLPNRLALWGALLAYLLLSGALLVALPSNAAPDEAAHLEYVDYLAQRHAFPVFQGAVPPHPGYEFHQPPLYYLLCAPVWSALLHVPAAGQYGCRLVSLTIGALTILVIWAASVTLFPERRDLAALAVWFAALWPLHEGVGASCNNDGLSGLWCAFLFFGIARIATRPFGARDLVGLGLVAGLGLWTKNTILGPALAAAFAAAFICARRPPTKITPILAAGMVLGVMALVGLPWMIRNTVLYGDPLALHVFSVAATLGTPGYPQFSQVGIVFPDYARGMLIMIFATAWGLYGGPGLAAKMFVPLSRHAHVPPPGMTGIILLLVGVKIVMILGSLRLYRRWPAVREAARAYLGPVALSWTLGTGVIVASWLWFAYNHFSGGQARYLHPALLPVCILAALAWTQFWGRGVERTLAAIAVGAVLLGLDMANILVWRSLS